MFFLVRSVSKPKLCTVTVFAGPVLEPVGVALLEHDPTDAHGFKLDLPQNQEQLIDLLFDIDRLKPDYKIKDMLYAHAKTAWQKGYGIESTSPDYTKSVETVIKLMQYLGVVYVYKSAMFEIGFQVHAEAKRCK